MIRTEYLLDWDMFASQRELWYQQFRLSLENRQFRQAEICFDSYKHFKLRSKIYEMTAELSKPLSKSSKLKGNT